MGWDMGQGVLKCQMGKVRAGKYTVRGYADVENRAWLMAAQSRQPSQYLLMFHK